MTWKPTYATLEEFKLYMSLDGLSQDPQDDLYELALESGSRAIDHHCNRQFGKVLNAVARKYTAEWDRDRSAWVVEIDDLMDTDGLSVTVDGEAITDYVLYPLNAELEEKPYTKLVVRRQSSTQPNRDEGGITITAKWGWNSVPEPVREATLKQAYVILRAKDAPFGVAGSPDMGSEMRLLSKLDPMVELSLRPYIRWWGAV